MTKLTELKIGEHGRIISLQQCSHAYRHKLQAMGLTRGTEFTLLRKAPLGDPIILVVRGFSLSLRKEETAGLEVERL